MRPKKKASTPKPPAALTKLTPKDIAVFTDEHYRLASIIVSREPRNEFGPALKTLRERAGLTQREIAYRFRRHATVVTAWEGGKSMPPRGMTAGLLEALMVPGESMVALLGNVGAGDLEFMDSNAYARGDAVEIEYSFFQRTRGSVLQSLYTRATEGDTPAAKLYKEWMVDNQREFDARQSKPKNVGSASTRDWVKAALSAALSSANADSTNEPKMLEGKTEADSGDIGKSTNTVDFAELVSLPIPEPSDLT